MVCWFFSFKCCTKLAITSRNKAHFRLRKNIFVLRRLTKDICHKAKISAKLFCEFKII